jgi:hypothetical protein
MLTIDDIFGAVADQMRALVDAIETEQMREKRNRP